MITVENGIVLRAMGEQDIEYVMPIERHNYPFPWSAGNFRDALRAGYDGWILSKQQVIAYAVIMFVLDEAHLLNLTVSHEYQRQGRGKGLLIKLMANALQRGSTSMLLEVRPGNAPAIGMYQSLGFKRIGLRKNYYPDHDGRREDAVVMRCSLHAMNEERAS